MMMENTQNVSENKKAIKAGLGFTIGNILINCIAFVSIPIFTRLLTTSEYGIYSSFMAYEAIFSVVIGLALHVSLKNAKYDFSSDRHGYNSSILLLMVLCFAVFIVLGAFFQESLGKLLGLDSSFVLPLVFYSAAAALLMLYNAHLLLDYHYRSYLIISFLYSIGSILLAVFLILVVFPQDRSYGRVLGGMIPIVLVGLFIIWSFWRVKKPVINRAYWKYGLKISLPIIPHGLSQLVLTQFDRIMILRIIGSSAAGIYSLAYTLAMVLQTIYTSLDSVWVTWFFERMSKKEYREIKEKSRYYVILISLITIMFFLVVPEVIMVFAGEAYWDAKFVAIPVALALYFSFLYYFPVGVEYYYKKTVFVSVGTVLAATVNILLNLWLIPLYGYVIAAYTTLVSYILYFLLHLFIAWKLDRRFVFDMKGITASLVVTSIFAAISILCLDLPLVRWGLFLLLLGCTLVGLYKKRNLLRRV